MNPKILFRAFLLVVAALLCFQCSLDSDEKPQIVPTQDQDLLGLDASIEGQVLATFTMGLPKTSLDRMEYDKMFRQVANYTQHLDGSLVNFYVEKKVSEEGSDYFLVLSGELEDDSYLTTGMRLVDNGGGSLVLDRGRPIPIFSCRNNGCLSSCGYDYSNYPVITCKYCQGGSCDEYIPGTEGF